MGGGSGVNRKGFLAKLQTAYILTPERKFLLLTWGKLQVKA